MATAEENYNATIGECSAITEDQFLNRYGAVHEIVSDARRMKKLLESDYSSFTTAGFPSDQLDSLTAKIDTYEIASSKANTAIAERAAALTSWEEGETRAVELKRELIRHFQFLYRNNSAVLEKVADISRGQGRSDLILDLKQLATLGKSNPSELESAPLFNMAWLDEAETVHTELSPVLAELETSSDVNSELLTISKQAFTHLERTLKDIRDYAAYIFHSDSSKVDQYKRDYWKN